MTPHSAKEPDLDRRCQYDDVILSLAVTVITNIAERCPSTRSSSSLWPYLLNAKEKA